MTEKAPICEECDIEMHPFAHGAISGWACGGCGWSHDDPKDDPPVTMTPPLRLVLTCGACPEQYDVFDGERQVGYIRLRHGTMRVDCPDAGGQTVYTAHPEGDGMFEDHERDYYLRFAVDAIQRWMNGESNPRRPPAPDVEYQIDG